LTEDGCVVECADSIGSTVERLENKFFNIVLLDLKLPDGSGLDLLKEIKNKKPDISVIILTGYASTESAVLALNQGAFSYLRKPLNPDELKITIKKSVNEQKLSAENKNLLNKLKELSLKDTLTELYNYRYLMERLSSEVDRAKRYKLSFCILLIDLNYFKSVNDVYGHQYGDRILKELAEYLKYFSRESDVIARYGEDEFVIIMPEIDERNAVTVAERLLNSIENHTFDSQGKKLKLKISIGVSGFPKSGHDKESLLHAADQSLQNVKEKGSGTPLLQETPAPQHDKKKVGKVAAKLASIEKRANQTVLESIYGFLRTIEAKDYATSKHTEQTVSIVTKIGQKLNLSEKDIESLRHAAALHDLGKIGIPDNILRKKRALSKKEFEIMKKHAQTGAEIVRPLHFLQETLPMILYHHERFDGLGYPLGLKGKEIPIGARIIAVADVYQALVSKRPYRNALDKKEALKIIKKNSGTHFDPELVEVFLSIIKDDYEKEKKILVVDDDLKMRTAVVDMLKIDGYRVLEAITVEETMDKIKEKKPDLVVLDVMLPKTKAYELYKELRKKPSTAKLPVIMISGRKKLDPMLAETGKGAFCYIVKGSDSAKLLSAVNEALKSHFKTK